MRRKASAMLLAQPETIDQPTVFVDVRPLEVIEELAPAAHHPQQPAPRMMILDVRLEMLGKVRDARRQQRDLDLGRSRITRGALVILDQLGLLIVVDHLTVLHLSPVLSVGRYLTL